MNTMLWIFLPCVLLLLGLLLWAVRPARIEFGSVDELMAVLSSPRHHFRMPQILQALKESDTDFLIERNQKKLAGMLRKERVAIALKFLSLLEKDYQVQIEASRALAAWAPEVGAMKEWQRLKLAMRFRLNCKLVNLRLRAGLPSWRGLKQLSDMAIQLSYGLERAMDGIAKGALLAAEFPSVAQNRGGDSR